MMSIHISWHLYLSPAVKYFDVHDNYFYYMIVYYIIAVLCELIIGIGFPVVLMFQKYFTRYCNINFTSTKSVMDQLKGCYKEEYHWFAAYYLLCRQLLYVVDIGTDFISDSFPEAKFPIMLTVYVLITMVHVWLQPYKQRKLLIFIGEHTTYGSTVVFPTGFVHQLCGIFH